MSEIQLKKKEERKHILLLHLSKIVKSSGVHRNELFSYLGEI